MCIDYILLARPCVNIYIISFNPSNYSAKLILSSVFVDEVN